MKLRVNDECKELPEGSTIEDLIHQLQVPEDGTVISVDGEIVSKKDFPRHRLSDNAEIEVMVFVGGG